MSPEERKAYNAQNYQEHKAERLAQQAIRAQDPAVKARRNELARIRAAIPEAKAAQAERNREWNATHKAEKAAYAQVNDQKPERKAAKQTAQKTWRKSHPFNHILRTYGLTETAFNTMWAEQAGCCKICGTAMSLVAGHRNSVHVDHKHGAGVRDLLCLSCNTGLGKFKEQPELLGKAIRYLEEHA